MKMWSVLAVALVTAALGLGAAHAGNDPTAAGALPTPSAPPSDDLSLLLSIRALAGPMPLSIDPGGTGSDVERVKAPTGAGSDRWPTGELAKGVYISVMPACIPGVDEPIGPTRRAPARRR
jgi:hypothetical protein